MQCYISTFVLTPPAHQPYIQIISFSIIKRIPKKMLTICIYFLYVQDPYFHMTKNLSAPNEKNIGPKRNFLSKRSLKKMCTGIYLMRRTIFPHLKVFKKMTIFKSKLFLYGVSKIQLLYFWKFFNYENPIGNT